MEFQLSQQVGRQIVWSNHLSARTAFRA